ncbi:MAG: hypothetical protein IH596_01040 [Bacteroidales bacterium]|nr:hypothetical protein [Bacteroidales bacterium]
MEDRLPGSDFQGSKGQTSKTTRPTGIRCRDVLAENIQQIKLKIMKKIMISIVMGLIMIASSIQSASAKDVFYVGLKIGIFAKFQIIFGNKECKEGKAICLRLFTDSPQNFMGYDADTEKFFLKISKNDPVARNFSLGTFEVLEDSWVDPDLVSALTKRYDGMKVFIKQGVYKVVDAGEHYIVGVDYYAQ